MEGIEGDLHTSLMPSLVANRLLEEDAPRYTRASDTCERDTIFLQSFSGEKLSFYYLLLPSVTVQRYGSEGFDVTEMDVSAPEHQSGAKYVAEPQSSTCKEPISSTTVPDLESKAQRIARYKAERRRQLAERYGISLDQEPDSDCYSRYTRTQKDSEDSERRRRGELFSLDQGRSESVGEEGRHVDSYTRRSSTNPEGGQPALRQSHSDRGYEVARRGMGPSERERLMNLENQRRAAVPLEAPSSSSYVDVTAPSLSSRVPSKDDCVTGMPPSSPQMSRQSSLSSPKQGVSAGELLIEQQQHSSLSRQGWVFIYFFGGGF